MLTDDQRESIRRAYHRDGKSLRQTVREFGISREAVTSAGTATPFVPVRPQLNS